MAARVLGTRLGARLGRSLVVHALRHVPLFAQFDEATVDFEHSGLVVTQRDSTLLEVGQPLRVRAREATRLVLLNPRAEGASSPRLAA